MNNVWYFQTTKILHEVTLPFFLELVTKRREKKQKGKEVIHFLPTCGRKVLLTKHTHTFLPQLLYFSPISFLKELKNTTLTEFLPQSLPFSPKINSKTRVSIVMHNFQCLNQLTQEKWFTLYVVWITTPATKHKQLYTYTTNWPLPAKEYCSHFKLSLIAKKNRKKEAKCDSNVKQVRWRE